MAATYNSTVANSRLTVVRDAVDQGATFGKLVIGTSALSGATGVLVTFILPDPSGSIASRILTLLGVPIAAVAFAGGVAAKAELRDSNNVVICSGLTVGVVGSATDIIVDTTAIVSTRTVYLLSGTITHP